MIKGKIQMRNEWHRKVRYLTVEWALLGLVLFHFVSSSFSSKLISGKFSCELCLSVCACVSFYFSFILSILFPASYLFTFSINFHVQSENSIQSYTQQQHSGHLTFCRHPTAPNNPNQLKHFPLGLKWKKPPAASATFNAVSSFRLRLQKNKYIYLEQEINWKFVNVFHPSS